MMLNHTENIFSADTATDFSVDVATDSNPWSNDVVFQSMCLVVIALSCSMMTVLVGWAVLYVCDVACTRFYSSCYKYDTCNFFYPNCYYVVV